MEIVTQIFDGLLAIIQGFLGTPSQTIAILLGAGGVSILTQVTKKLAKIEKEKASIALFTLIAFLASLLDWFVTNGNNLPPSILGANTALIMGVAQPIYFYVVKPFTRFWGEFQSYKQALRSKVTDIEAAHTVTGTEAPVMSETVETPTGPVETEVHMPVPVDVPKTTTEAPVQKVATF